MGGGDRNIDGETAEVYVLRGHTDCVTGISLSPDGERLVSNSRDGAVQLWDVRSYVDSENGLGSGGRALGMMTEGVSHDREQNLLRAEWSRDGLHFGAASGDRILRIQKTDFPFEMQLKSQKISNMKAY